MPRLSEQRETIKSRHNADTIKNNLLKNKSSRYELSPFLPPRLVAHARGLLIKITRSKGNFTYIAGVTIVINLILAWSNCAAPIILRRRVRKSFGPLVFVLVAAAAAVVVVVVVDVTVVVVVVIFACTPHTGQ